MDTKLAAVFHQSDFDLVGILPIGESRTTETLEKWLADGKHGDMSWMAREDAVAKRADARKILPGAASLVSLAWKYTPPEIPDELLNDPSRGIIARYALYDDYHDVIKKALHRLAAGLQKQVGEFDYKAYVDTGPFLEREWANRAGLGYIGRNSNLIHYEMGSYLFLAELLVTADLPPHKEKVIGRCGSCTNCVDDCPTGAILDNRTIDARKCISYITIEYKGAIPEQLRPLMRNRLYGCDICQEVCPWNRSPSAQQKASFPVREDLVAPPLQDLLFFDDASFRERFRKSPITRAKREGFMRNVAVAAGNWGTPEARQLLREIEKNDESELVREHARWGLRQCT